MFRASRRIGEVERTVKAATLKVCAYRCVQATWGFPQSALGALLAASVRGAARSSYRGAVVTYWRREAGLSLGMFIFLPEACRLDDASLMRDTARGNAESGDVPPVSSSAMRARELHHHEYGHTIQSLVLGPLYLPVVGIPSLVWAGFPPVARKWRTGARGYYSFVTERSADRLAARFTPRRDTPKH